MKTNSPTHQAIAQRAHEIWDVRGHPTGTDTEIWLEAEGELTAASPGPQRSRSVESCERPSAAGHSAGGEAPAPSPDDLAAKAAIQKNAARAPQLQHGKNAPRPAPTESGKPLWDKPHSS